MARGRVLKVLYHDLKLGSSRFVWEMQLVKTRNGLSFRFGIEDGHKETPKGHTRNWQVSFFNRHGFGGTISSYYVSSACGGDRRIGEKMIAEMEALAERHKELLREAA
ncbi:MAG TPA: hypothetical protein PLD70_12290 [Thermotogota bacterium]|nr:hypothetical protein [Thermotogota bacterium]